MRPRRRSRSEVFGKDLHIHVPRPRFRHLVHGDFYLDLDGGQATGGVRTWCGQASSRFCVWDPSYHTAPDHVSVHMVSVVLEMCSRCTSTPLPAHTPVRHRRHTDERSDCKAIPFLTSHVHGHVLHSNGWLVVSPRGRPHMPHLRVRPPALSLTSCFIILRGWTRQRYRNPHVPVAVPRPTPSPGIFVLHIHEHHAPTTARCPPLRFPFRENL